MRRNAKVFAFVASSVLMIGCLINKTFPKQNEFCFKQKTIHEMKAIVSVERPKDIKRAKYAREIKAELQNLWHATEFEFKRVLRSNDRNKSIDQAEKDLLQTIWALEIQLENIQSLDITWQAVVANKTANMVSDLIDSHQNPHNCNERGQLFGHPEVCGYGCMVHNILEQFFMALSNNKTLFTYPFGCIYLGNETTLKNVFQPFSKNCSLRTGDWKEVETYTDLKVNDLSYILGQHMTAAGPRRYSVFTEELWNSIELFHGKPRAWLAGKLVRYITRPTKHFYDVFNKLGAKVDFTRPLVGLHIRRSDKLTSDQEYADFHPFSKYMKHVEKWYRKYEMRQVLEGSQNKVKRRVYLATDDPGIWDETLNYEEYEFIGQRKFAKRASNERTRETSFGLFEIANEINILSMCNFIVCTFSSEVGTLAYEYMQTLHLNAADKVLSLDAEYGPTGAPVDLHRVIYSHNVEGELPLQHGMLATGYQQWNGYFYGTNKDLNWQLYPSYKVQATLPVFAVKNGKFSVDLF
uniref:alpha-(1,6)-fucosyltransferase-like isoform X2 n=1 Tax=Ciona intestinalis TaxID=7719 RepID=UPI000EF50B03|nr:alpha-(1,6)-fucosyltransferase-like isoform X2 [Ciona intestinalis]|eukprot:XP_026693474.1 alpha-(1,6)-fucosyltransferase-like isoform X2 [Ciona intestinalis]